MIIEKKPARENIEVHAQKQVPRQKVKIGSFKVHPGQKIYELNLNTLEIIEATIDETRLHIDGSKNHVINQKDNTLYAVAINKLNAARKFNLMLTLMLQSRRV
jgi:hypothetical protein